MRHPTTATLLHPNDISTVAPKRHAGARKGGVGGEEERAPGGVVAVLGALEEPFACASGVWTCFKRENWVAAVARQVGDWRCIGVLHAWT